MKKSSNSTRRTNIVAIREFIWGGPAIRVPNPDSEKAPETQITFYSLPLDETSEESVTISQAFLASLLSRIETLEGKVIYGRNR
ncbi:MAG: hypothetical protein KGL39_44710 [Patescibacteria group bacterium]|nr:hypothetical protein [Patescibacteria group bacterium]